MRCEAGFMLFCAAVICLSTTAHATQVRVNGVTTFFDNYEDATNVASGEIPTTNTAASFVPNSPQVGTWNSFQGTASPNFENVQVTDFETPGAFSGTKYLRTFRTPNLNPDTPFESNPGTRIGYDGVNVTANVGDTYHFETMIRAQLQVTNVVTMGVVGVNDLSTFSGIDMINVGFRSDGAIMTKTVNSPSTFVDTGLVWVQDTWDVLKIDYVDGADTYTLTYGNQDPLSFDLIKDIAGETGVITGNKRVGLITFGNGAGGTATGNGAINGGSGSRLYYDSVDLDPIETLPGDFNLDGNVDAADYVVWRKNPDSFLPATYDTWRANFGDPTESSASFSQGVVPEPGTCTLVIAAAMAGWIGHFRRSRQSKQ